MTMCKVKFQFFILSLFFSVAAGQGFAGPTKLASGDTAQTDYWVPKKPPKAHYKIDCSIDLSQGLLEGTEIIRFRNTTSRAMHRLEVKWTSLGSMEITSKDKVVKILAKTKEGSESSSTLVELPKPVSPGDEIELEFKFSGVKVARAVGNKMVFLGWHPKLWWGFETQDDFDVKVEVPPEYMLATSGVFNSKTGCYHAEGVRSFGLVLCKDHNVIEANAGGVLVRCIHTPKGEKCARLLLDTAVDVINFYRELYGFYPYANLTIIPGMSHPAGGYPVATNVVAIHGMERFDSMPRLHWQWITAHEVGHQYWLEHVSTKDSHGWGW
jgi:hypothetical protein